MVRKSILLSTVRTVWCLPLILCFKNQTNIFHYSKNNHSSYTRFWIIIFVEYLQVTIYSIFGRLIYYRRLIFVLQCTLFHVTHVLVNKDAEGERIFLLVQLNWRYTVTTEARTAVKSLYQSRNIWQRWVLWKFYQATFRKKMCLCIACTSF